MPPFLPFFVFWGLVLMGSLLEAYTIGTVVTFYDTTVVLEALVITLGLFLGLTLFTFQSKWDFSGMGPFLFGGLWALILSGFVMLFFPHNGFNRAPTLSDS
jgi:protein lifeguard